MKPTLLFLTFIIATATADDGILLQRVVALENRVAELEAKLAPVLEEERVKLVAKEQRLFARERMMLDAEIFSRLDLNLIEKAYQTAERDWTSEEAAKALALLREKFPTANRTGCAMLAMAQASSETEQVDLLEQAIAKHGSCYYPNGVNVGAYARLYLGLRHYKDGEKEKAAEYFAELRSDFPDSIDHKGQLLTAHLAGLD